MLVLRQPRRTSVASCSKLTLTPLCRIAGDLEPLANDRRVELDLREDRRIGMEEDRRSRMPRAAPSFFSGADGLALAEAHLPLRAIALDGRDELARQRVDDRRADAVQAAGRLVVGALELPAGVEHGEDDFERALVRLRMLVDGHAAAVVGDGNGRSVLVEGDARWSRRSRSSPRPPRCRGSPRPDGAGPRCPTPPMYMPGRLRTGSSPSRTVMSLAEYDDMPAAVSEERPSQKDLRLPGSRIARGAAARGARGVAVRGAADRRRGSPRWDGRPRLACAQASFAATPDLRPRIVIGARAATLPGPTLRSSSSAAAA